MTSHDYVSVGRFSHLVMLTGQARFTVALVLAGRSDWQRRRFLILAGPAGAHFGLDVLSDGHPLVPRGLRPLKYRLERLVDVLGLWWGDSEGQGPGLDVRPASLHHPARLSSLDLNGSVGRDVIVLPARLGLALESLLLQLITERFTPSRVNTTGAPPLTIIRSLSGSSAIHLTSFGARSGPQLAG